MLSYVFTNKPRPFVPEVVLDEIRVLYDNFCLETSLAIFLCFVGIFSLGKKH